MFPYRPEYSQSCSAYGTIVVDVCGLGKGAYDRLRQLRYSVRDYNGGHFATKRTEYVNRRAGSFWELARRFEEGRIAIPSDPELFADGRIQLERKQDLKNRLGRSPDKADALSMIFFVGNTAYVRTLYH